MDESRAGKIEGEAIEDREKHRGWNIGLSYVSSMQ